MTHATLCELLGIVPSEPAPSWLPYAVRKTKIEIVVDGMRRLVFGGAHVCGCCGFGVDARPVSDGKMACPRCKATTPDDVSEEQRTNLRAYYAQAGAS